MLSMGCKLRTELWRVLGRGVIVSGAKSVFSLSISFSRLHASVSLGKLLNLELLVRHSAACGDG